MRIKTIFVSMVVLIVGLVLMSSVHVQPNKVDIEVRSGRSVQYFQNVEDVHTKGNRVTFYDKYGNYHEFIPDSYEQYNH